MPLAYPRAPVDDVRSADAEPVRSEPVPVGAARFREALGRHASGVAVVTVAGPGGPVGFTATSFNSVSLDPPLVSFYLSRESASWPAVRVAGHFAVNLLAADQAALAARFALPGADRFAPPTRWRAGPEGVPLLAGVTTQLVCAQRWTAPVGDHFLVMGTVVCTRVGAADTPLLHAGGRFGAFAPDPHRP